MTSCLPMGQGVRMRRKTTRPAEGAASERSSKAKDGALRDSCFEAEDSSGKGKQSHGWLAKVRNRLRTKHGQQQQQQQGRCEKCGQKSDTCLPNPSFLTERKHYLCADCRVSACAVKDVYQQLCRHFSLHEPPRVVGNNRELAPSPPSSSSRSSRGVVRSRSMRTRPLPPESGYDTATSVESSSCSGCGRLSPESVYGSPGERGPCALRPDGAQPPCSSGLKLPDPLSARDTAHPRDRAEVFGAAFKSEKTHLRDIQLRDIQLGAHTRIYTRQDAPPPYRPKHPPPAHPHTPPCKAAPRYEGYMESGQAQPGKGGRCVVRQREEWEGGVENDEEQSDHLARRRHTETLKLCYRCHKFRCIAFRAPLNNGWLCEDCMDDLM